jgi:putative flippase GtrA
MAGNANLIIVTRESRVLRFLLAGGAATALHWLVMGLFVLLGVTPVLATAAGAGVGLVFNYLAQHAWAFRSQLAHRQALPRYLASALIGWCLNLAVFSSLQQLNAGIVAAQIGATALVALINFLLSERFVFHEQQ